MKLTFEISNPHDTYTMTADTHLVAAVAVCILGEGKYGLKGMAPNQGVDVPIFLFGGEDPWFTSAFGVPFSQALTDCMSVGREQLALAMESITCVGTRSSMVNLAELGALLARDIRNHQPEAA